VIVVDASALLAILEGEPDAAKYAEALADADSPLISVATLIEAGIVMMNRHGPKAVAKLHALIQEAGIEVENVTPRHARIAIDAFALYGKGRQHKAGLNYGDCFVYALAKAMGLPLLFKGNDFPHTDLTPAL
jgi:ribonuclease VapC